MAPNLTTKITFLRERVEKVFSFDKPLLLRCYAWFLFSFNPCPLKRDVRLPKLKIHSFPMRKVDRFHGVFSDRFHFASSFLWILTHGNVVKSSSSRFW